MAHASWTAPLIVQFPYKERRTITGPFDAMNCLIDRWPNMRGLKFLKARTSCRAALDDRLTAYIARRDFVDAVAEAGGTTH
jgi:hypothetical protein